MYKNHKLCIVIPAYNEEELRVYREKIEMVMAARARMRGQPPPPEPQQEKA
jgi:hypothetical protein